MIGVLPRELYIAIVKQISQEDTSTLYQLLLSSKVLYEEASRLLYEVVWLKSGLEYGEEQENVQRELSLLTTICQNPDLARLVHDFKAFPTMLSTGSLYWQTLARALQALTHLKRLTFWSVDWGTPDGTTSLLRGCTFYLQSLDWLVAYEPSIVTFLESQPHIKYITLNWTASQMPNLTPLPPSVLPNLRVLVGSLTVVHKLLPGREVTHLHWSSDSSHYEDPDLTYIGPALSYVRVLKYGTYVDTPAMDRLARCLNNLKILYWVVKEDDWRFIETLLSCLNTLKKVHKLVLVSKSERGSIVTPSLLATIFERSPSMRKIVGGGDGAWRSWAREDLKESPIVGSEEATFDDGDWMLE